MHKLRHHKKSGSMFLEKRMLKATLTIYPDEGTGSTTTDGGLFRSSVSESWSTIRNNSGATFISQAALQARNHAQTTSSLWRDFVRVVAGFDTSAVGTSGIASVVFSAVANTKVDNFSGSIVLAGMTLANNNDLVSGDYDITNFGTTELATRKTIASINVGGSTYTDWTLNASGEAEIDPDGVTNFSILIADDFDDSETSWASSQESRVEFYASEEFGSSKDPKIVIIVTSAPTVTTSAPTSVDEDSATGNGDITDDGGSAIIERGFIVSEETSAEIGQDGVLQFVEGGTATGVYSASMTGLSPGTSYQCRAYAENSVGIAYGADQAFSTDAVAPSVTTKAPSEITSTTATGRGRVDSDGGAVLSERGFVYDTQPNPDTSDSKVIVSGQEGSYTGEISGLTISTTYHVRAYAINTEGTSYGANFSFITTETEDDIVFNGLGLQNSDIVTSILLQDSTPTREIIRRPIPLDHGAVILGDKWREKIVTLRGIIRKTTSPLLEAALDELKEVCSKLEGVLDIKIDGVTRRYRGTLMNGQSIFSQREHFHVTFIPFELQFLVVDPFGKALGFVENNYAAETSITNSKTINNSGSAPAKPIITIDVTAASGITKLVLTNNTTEEVFTLNEPLVSSDQVIINSEDRLVTINGAVKDYDGVFPSLEIEDNEIDLDLTGASMTYDLNIKHKNLFL